MNMDTLLSAWKDRALLEWERHVEDKDRSLEITGYFIDVGWNHWIRGAYINRARYAWCGIFAGACGLRLGECLDAPNTFYVCA